MNLSTEAREELNKLLSNRKLKIPDFRRVVSPAACNYAWLQRNLMICNSEAVSDRLKELLCIHKRKCSNVEEVNPTLEQGELNCQS